MAAEQRCSLRICIADGHAEGVHLHENFLSVIAADAEQMKLGFSLIENQFQLHMFLAVFDIGVIERFQRKFDFLTIACED